MGSRARPGAGHSHHHGSRPCSPPALAPNRGGKLKDRSSRAGTSPAQWRGTPEAPWSRTDLTEGPKRPPSTGQSRPIAPRRPPPGTAGSQWCPPGWGHGGSPPSLSALAHLGSDSECQQGSGTRANVCALCTCVCTNECGVCARKLHVYMPGTPPFHRRPLPGRPGSRAGSSQPLGCCPDPKPRSAPSGAALTCAAGAFLVASEPHELLHWVLSSYRPGAEGVLRLGVGGALRPRPPSLCSSHTLVWPGCFTETNDMSFPLPVGTEGAPAPTGPGWPPLSPETLSSPTPEPSRESQLGVGGPAAAPTPRPVLGGTKAIVGSMFMCSAPAPSSGAGPCGREGPGAKPRLLLCRTLVWDKHRAPGSSAHAALPTATLWSLREGRCAAAWWVWIPGSPGGWGTGDSLRQGHAGSRGAVHTGHGPRRPRTWGQGEPRAGPGGS